MTLFQAIIENVIVDLTLIDVFLYRQYCIIDEISAFKRAYGPSFLGICTEGII